MLLLLFFFFKQKTAYELRISDWSSDVCSSDLHDRIGFHLGLGRRRRRNEGDARAVRRPGEAFAHARQRMVGIVDRCDPPRARSVGGGDDQPAIAEIRHLAAIGREARIATFDTLGAAPGASGAACEIELPDAGIRHTDARLEEHTSELQY